MISKTRLSQSGSNVWNVYLRLLNVSLRFHHGSLSFTDFLNAEPNRPKPRSNWTKPFAARCLSWDNPQIYRGSRAIRKAKLKLRLSF
jgi:hypothetical protein